MKNNLSKKEIYLYNIFDFEKLGISFEEIKKILEINNLDIEEITKKGFVYFKNEKLTRSSYLFNTETFDLILKAYEKEFNKKINKKDISKRIL